MLKKTLPENVCDSNLRQIERPTHALLWPSDFLQQNPRNGPLAISLIKRYSRSLLERGCRLCNSPGAKPFPLDRNSFFCYYVFVDADRVIEWNALAQVVCVSDSAGLRLCRKSDCL